MDPFSAAVTGWKAGTAIGGFLAAKDAVIRVVNNSSHDANVAMCIGSFTEGHSGGWITVPSGHTWAEQIKVSRISTTDLVIYGEVAGRPNITWSGDINFYVIHESGFLIKSARTTDAQQLSGSGRMAVVSGDLHSISGDFTYTLNP